MKKHIPNLITTLSLICGCLAIIVSFDNQFTLAACLLIAAAIFDFFDGFAARLLGVSSALGEQLDSLIDMVSFGVAPGIMLYQFTKMLNEVNEIPFLTENSWLFYLTFLIPILSAFRLAKFNIDTRQTDSFIGLAVPAHASFYIFAILIQQNPELPKLIDLNAVVLPLVSNPLVLLGVSATLSFLLVSEIPMFALKLKNFGWKGNEVQFTFLIGSVVLIALLNIIALPIIILMYIGYSLITGWNNRPEPLKL